MRFDDACDKLKPGTPVKIRRGGVLCKVKDIWIIHALESPTNHPVVLVYLDNGRKALHTELQLV